MSAKKEVKEVKRFVLSEGMKGKGLTVRWTRKKDGKVIEYDHDKVLAASKVEALPCWAKYKNYTSTTSIPSFAKELVKE